RVVWFAQELNAKYSSSTRFSTARGPERRSPDRQGLAPRAQRGRTGVWRSGRVCSGFCEKIADDNPLNTVRFVAHCASVLFANSWTVHEDLLISRPCEVFSLAPRL